MAWKSAIEYSMDLRRIFLTAAVLCCGLCAQPARLHDVPDLDKNMKTGPAVGARIPPFAIVDQFGKMQTFETLRGPKGLFLMFVRSADW